MTTTNKKRRASHHGYAPRGAFQINPVAAACSALIFATGVAYAQTEPAKDADKKDKAEEVQTVTVTGIRKGIESAISVKKNSDNIVESISAEDIGKLPDASIAESIARLPGLTAQRDPKGGAAKTISIRGMSPDFATALLNGREVVSTSDSRNVEFDQYPSEMLGGVNVYKTPDGGLVGQGLAGTVDMLAVRPLNFGGRQVVLNYRQEQNGVGALAEGSGNRYSFSYIDQFADRTIGLAIGYAKTDRDLGAQTRGGCWGLADYTYNAQAIRTCGGFEFFTDLITEQREGVMAVLEWKPNKNFSSTLDLMYSTYQKQIDKKGFQGGLIWGGGDTLPYGQPRVLRDATVVDGVAVSGTWDNFRGIIRNDAQSIDDELQAIGWNNKLKLADGWSAAADLSYSTADRKEVVVETTASTPTFMADTLAFDSTGSSFRVTPGLSYADPSEMKLTDVMGWGGGPAAAQAGYTKLPHVTDELASIRLSGRKDLDGGWFSGIDFGVNYADRMKNREFIEGQLRIKGGDPFGFADMPGGSSMQAGDSGLSIATFDPVANLNAVYDIAAKRHPDIYNKDWDVKERLTTAYAKADIDTEMFGIPVRGNLGLQYVHADQSSTAWVVNRAVPGQDDADRTATLTTNGETYGDVLPSLNLAFDLGSQNILRLGLAKVMARPNMADMRTSFAFAVDVQTGLYSGSGGNPWLRPFRANAIDLAYEKYWGNKAYVGAAAFYKDVKTYVVNESVAFDFGPYVTADTTPAPGGNVGFLTVPVNGKGGSVSGYELAASVPLDMLWKPLSGFGLAASYSNTRSSLNPPDITDGGAGKMELPGLSKEVSSITAYYENSGFQVRVSQRQRSDFIGERRTDIGDRQLVYIKGEAITDAQIGYEFQSGWLKGLGVLLQGYNLSNTKYKRYADTPNNVVETVNVGTTYLLGINYKL
ncbi:MAG TPA: TonB-dependent receptor [Ideonella sp.]|uniref:TonB-dependent receptor n=1 Tax=Ideonella sp. TaxID=1929293 RepID=UPI002E328949|nr:TonB-dependent receptor [Ideonella sp.]HEX5682396.1 TonB-dependent receptor [Ideonella sp.]